MTVATPQTAGEANAGRTTFARLGYTLLPALLEPELTRYFWSYVLTKFASRLIVKAGDNLVDNAPACYGDPAFDGLLEFLRPRVEEQTGLRLLPTYSYFRIYRKGDVLKRHRDRPACEISVSLNIGQTPAEPWPIHIERDAGAFCARLSPGDAVLYRGIDCFHWRDAYEGTQLVQVFLHYVDRDGPHADQKFDGRATLMRPDRRPAGNQAADAG